MLMLLLELCLNLFMDTENGFFIITNQNKFMMQDNLELVLGENVEDLGKFDKDLQQKKKWTLEKGLEKKGEGIGEGKDNQGRKR